MKVKKLTAKILITVFILSTLVGLVAMPVSAATAISAKYVFEDHDTTPDEVEVRWSADRAVLGEYSARLLLTASAAGGDYAYIRVYPDNPTVTLSDLDTDPATYIPTFSYWLATDNAVDHPDLELYFSDGGLGWAEISVFPTQTYVWDKTDNQWNLADGLDGGVFAVVYGKDSLGSAFSRDLGSDPLSAVIDYVLTQVTDPGDWVLTRVTPQIGWGQKDIEAYIDNVTIAGVTYDLEPQSITAGESYNIQWATGQASKDVTMLYTPEGIVDPDIEMTIPTSSGGVVNFYNVLPHYAGNWILSDLSAGAPVPTMDADGLVMLQTEDLGTNHFMYTYFLVQPAEDYDVVISPSVLDVDSGTVALTVTVTDEGEPVADAYVSIEFWDNEAENYETADTALLRDYTIQTASNGMAMFDIDVPEVAGTIHVTAGTDLQPDTVDPDGEYFEHWGYDLATVSEIGAIEITVSPTTYMMGIPFPLTINLENDLDDLNVLGACTNAYSVNVTLEGDDFEGTIATADLLEIAIDEVLADGVALVIDAGVYTIPSGTAELKISGQCDAFDQDDVVEIIIGDFTADELGDVTVSAGADIGGIVTSTIATLSAESAPDQLFDYLETAAKTLSVSEPGEINFVGLAPDEILACEDITLSFTAYYYDGTDTNLATDFDVTLEYPTGITYEGTTDGSGEFSASLQSGTEPYWADEAGTMTITVSGEVPEGDPPTDVAYSGMTTIPVTGFLISTDMEIMVVGTENNVTITVTDSLGIPINNAKVTMEPDAGDLTAEEMGTTYPEIDGTAVPINDGLYIFHDLTASQVCTITVEALTGSDPMARLFIEASNPVLTVSSNVSPLTNIVDNAFSIRVMDGTTPEEGASIDMNVSFTGDLVTNSTGWADVEIDYAELPVSVKAVRVYVVSEDVSKTGELVISVDEPIYVPSEEFSLTAGIDSEGNFTITSADGESTLLVDTIDASKVFATADIDLTDTAGDVLAGAELTVTDGYAWFELEMADSCDTLDKLNSLNITAVTALASLETIVASIPIYNPIVSNTTYSGFPITYNAYVGQSGVFYVKIQDASGEPVEGALVEIAGTTASGVTDADGETTIMWNPSSTGTCDLLLNEVLDIGTITVESYVAPQLVIDYTPETVYLDDTVTLSVAAGGDPVSFVSVAIIDPDGVLVERMTTSAGTCTFTADMLGVWSISASKTDYTDAVITIEVLSGVPVTEYDIDLVVGWNLISLPLIPDDPSITVILTDIVAYVDSIWAYDAVTGFWSSYSPSAPSDLTEMVNGKGYWMDMSAPTVLSVSGTEIFEEPPAPLPSYQLTEGWNLIGMPYIPEDTSINVVFSGILDHIESIWTYDAGIWSSYSPYAPSDLTEILDGKGYWIKMTTDALWEIDIN